MNSLKHNRIPERLQTRGRPVVPNFDPDEGLFRRFSEWAVVGGYLYPASIRFPEFSVNREKFSEPEDVLLHDYPNCKDWGIASFRVRDIPGPIVTGEGTRDETVNKFDVVHDPDEDNYSHSEVRAYKNNRRAKKVAKKVRQKFKFKLSEKMVVLKEPENTE